MANTYLSKTFSSAGNRRTWTFSAWVKRASSLSSRNIIFGSSPDGNTENWIAFQNNAKFWVKGQGTGTGWEIQTNRLARDTSAWYHIVVAFDSTQSTASDRVKLYVNGTQETSLSTSNYPDLNQEDRINNNVEHTIGRGSSAYTNYFSGEMSHIHFIDGTAYDASAFGETDANGVWKIKTSPSVTYGTNGFFILKDGNSVTDQSGNSNNFTVASGTLTKTEDSPSNVFATLNAIDKYAAELSNGATTVTNESNAATIVLSTLAVNSGKWYWEAKVEDSTADNFNVGIKKTGQNNYGVNGSAYNSTGWVYATDGNIYHGGSSILNTGTTCTVGDIIGFILDMDAGTLKLKKNGSDIYSGNAVVSSLNTGDHYHVVQGASQSIVSFNFGNGYFGTTAVSSAGTNASGIGIFEYDVPTGYTALSTKGLNL